MQVRNKRRAFTLVELMIVVAIIGILAALAIYGVSRYMRNAKTAEARSSLGAMARGNISYFNMEQWLQKTTMAPGGSAGALNLICDTSSVAVPAAVPKGTKYQSSDSDWTKDQTTAGVGYTCLKFSMDQPQMFQYAYTAVAAATQNGTFLGIAHGDLNGDGNTSEFSLAGAIQSHRVIIAPSISETAPDE